MPAGGSLAGEGKTGGWTYWDKTLIKWQGRGWTMKKCPWKKCLAGVLAAAVCLGAAGFLWGKRSAVGVWKTVRAERYQIILDAGHGGEDGGAVSITGVPESGLNLEIVLRLDQLLGFYGIPPILLRDRDISLHDPEAGTLREKKVSDLHNRVAAIESVENALLVSIHQNTFPSSAYHGAQVFYRPGEESKALAERVQEALQAADPENRRSPAKIPDSVYLMGHITCPAVLVECGFLSNPAEEARLKSGGYQNQLAICIASAVLKSGEIHSGETGGNVV